MKNEAPEVSFPMVVTSYLKSKYTKSYARFGEAAQCFPPAQIHAESLLTKKSWFFRKIAGLPLYYNLSNNENKVSKKNEPKPMQNEGSGAKTHGPGPRKWAVKHRRWRLTTKLVSRIPVSLIMEKIRCMPITGAYGGG